MATDALPLCLPGPSGQVFVRCLQIPALKLNLNISFERSGSGPQQEGGGGVQTYRIRGGAIRGNAWLGALGMGMTGPGWVSHLSVRVVDEVKGNQNTKYQTQKD